MNVNNIFSKILLSKYIQDYDYYSLQRAFIVNRKTKTSLTYLKLNNLFFFQVENKKIEDNGILE